MKLKEQAEGAAVTLRRAREIVSREIMAKAPGWAENADRMNAAYEAPTPDDADPAVFKAGTPYGASSVAGQHEGKPTDEDLEVARFQGKRVAQVARALKAMGETATKQ